MISVEKREAIRRAYFLEEKSIRQISREFSCSRPTVRKAISSAGPVAYRLTVPRPEPVLGAYKAQIDELLVENERLPRKQRYTGHRIYQLIKDQGYTGSESTVRRYVAHRRREKKRPQVYIPLEFDPGTDAQVDWGEGTVTIAGQRATVQVFVMRLCYSRRLFVMAFPTQKQEAFFEGHVQAFHHFQGVPQRISYDNLKAAVSRVLEGRNRQEQEGFIIFRSHYLFTSHFCTPGQAHRKGRVEDGVGFARRNGSTELAEVFMVPMPQVASFEELNAHLLAACLADDQRRIDRQEVTIGQAWEMERSYLRPLPEHDLECCATRSVTLNPYSQVEFETNRYSVPADKARRNLVIKAYPFRVHILSLEDVIASHPRCYDRRQDVLDPLHYRSAELTTKPALAGAATRSLRSRQAHPSLAEELALGL